MNASNIPATVVLNNGMKFEGVIKKINNCACVFKSEGKKYPIPVSDIKNIDTYNAENKKMINNFLSSQDKCLAGQIDAQYHGKRGGHFVLGLTTGLLGVIMVAIVANPKPYNGAKTLSMSENKDDFNDPTYLSCYKKKAKGKLIGSTSLGWVAWIGLVIYAASLTY